MYMYVYIFHIHETSVCLFDTPFSFRFALNF